MCIIKFHTGKIAYKILEMIIIKKNTVKDILTKSWKYLAIL